MTIFDLPSWTAFPLTLLLVVSIVLLGGVLFKMLRVLYSEENEHIARRPMALIGSLALLYASLIWFFGLVYRQIYYFDDTSFVFSDTPNFKDSFLSVYYFSVVTITSTGYGDIHPKTDAAMLAAMLEMLCGYFFTVLLFSAVAGLALRANRRPI